MTRYKILVCFAPASPYRMFKTNTFFRDYKQHTFYRFDRMLVGLDEKTDLRTICGKRRKLAKTKGTDVVHQMVQRAQSSNIPFDYVLFDTWFSNPLQLVSLKGTGADVIAMIKKNGTKYTWPNPETGE